MTLKGVTIEPIDTSGGPTSLLSRRFARFSKNKKEHMTMTNSRDELSASIRHIAGRSCDGMFGKQHIRGEQQPMISRTIKIIQAGVKVTAHAESLKPSILARMINGKQT